MNEDFVSFDLAKKLKEKGFDEECLAYYTSEYTLYLNNVVLCDDKYLDMAEIDYEECLRSYNTQKDSWQRTLVDAPTISQVLKWLREEKKLYIRVSVYFVGWCVDVTNMDGKRMYGTECEYYNYEQAALAGIEYVLYYLI